MQCAIKLPHACARRALGAPLCALLLLLAYLAAAYATLLLPDAAGTTVYEKGGTTIDASHAEQGYIMVRQEPNKSKLKVRLTLGKYSLTYDLNSDGEYEVYPLQLGNGKYKVQVFKQASGKKYSTLSTISFKVKLADNLSPYLYPNQFVNYGTDTQAVKMADELCAGLDSDEAKYEAIHAYVLENYTYDYDLAGSVTSGYLPSLDDVYEVKKGICFDIAALMACMLRSQGIAAQLVIGYADKLYHAWNLVYLDGDATIEICGGAVKKYTTERMY